MEDVHTKPEIMTSKARELTPLVYNHSTSLNHSPAPSLTVRTYLLTHSLHGAEYYLKHYHSTYKKNILLSLWNMKVHHHVHKCLPSDPILNQLNPVHLISLRSSLMLSSHLCLGLPSDLLLLGLPTKTL